MAKNKLAIFDLDGTLFDTTEVNYYAYKEAVECFGKTLDHSYFEKECNGKNYREFLPPVLGGDEHLEDIHKLKKDFYRKNLDKAKKNEALFDLIESIQNDYHIVLVTTASRKNALEILDFFHVTDCFENIIAQEDISHLKPDPEAYVLAMKSVNISGKATIIFEDSEVGLAAAKKTGASVFKVESF